ncbi:WxcM-like domain-containing protein [Flavobacteriaceae bacterium]|nr:WxcM-like domain-containing protein [Flavobacteriaceae bacterium]
MCSPKIIKGNSYTDQRGILKYNNFFNATAIKRMYVIENNSTKIFRGWRGHKIEQRWFSAVQGSFRIKLIEIDDWNSPSKTLVCQEIKLESKTLDVLHIPRGYVTSIRSIENNSKLLVMADYSIDEIKDEYRYDLNYFYS